MFATANAPPVAVIASPPPGAFFADGDTVWLRSASTDDQEPASALSYQWQVDLLHNNHIHPGYFTCTQASDYFVMHNHDDGTGVRYDIKLYVTDTGGLEDTAQVLARPEIDLAPSLVATTPDPPQVQSAVVYRFAIRNQGGMPAPVSRWTLSVDGVAIAQGDTAVAARDSVVLAISLPPQFPLGVHTLRLVADTIGQVAEVSEANNATTRPVSFESGPVPDLTWPWFVEKPRAAPYGTFAWVRWTNNEPTLGVVRYGAARAMADSIVAPVPATASHALLLSGLTPHVRYYYNVTSADLSGNRVTARIDSFVTTSGSVDQTPGSPLAFELANPTPNPTRGSVAFAVALPVAARVHLQVFDLLGREVWHGADAMLASGRWQLEWPGTGGDGRPARAGLYLARVRAGPRVFLRRIAVLR